MIEVGAREAEHTFGALLDSVERGEQVVITREGKPVAQMTRPAPFPEKVWTEEDRIKADAAYARMRSEAKALNLGPFNWEEYKVMRDEGRR